MVISAQNDQKQHYLLKNGAKWHFFSGKNCHLGV